MTKSCHNCRFAKSNALFGELICSNKFSHKFTLPVVAGEVCSGWRARMEDKQ